MICLLVKMGGSGNRFGSNIPKQYVELCGHPLFYWILEQYEKLGVIDKYILVSNPNWIDFTRNVAEEVVGDKLLDVIPGGSTMSKSIYNGVVFAHEYLTDNDIFLIHDVTNPVVASEQIRDVIVTVKQFGYAVLTTEQVHTIYQIDSDDNIVSVIPRQEVSSGYSPEGFLYGKIYNCYVSASTTELENMTSAIALAKKQNAQVKAIKSHIVNLKITYKEDLDLYRKMVENSSKLSTEPYAGNIEMFLKEHNGGIDR